MNWPNRHVHCIPLRRRLLPPESFQERAKLALERQAGKVFRCLAWEGTGRDAPHVREGWTLEQAVSFSLGAATVYSATRGGEAPLSAEVKMRRKVDRLLLGWSPKVRAAFKESK